jgi:hypothetical protein
MANAEGTLVRGRGAGRWLFAGVVVSVASLLVGTSPLMVYSPGDTDETNCGDAWGPLREALPAPCYSTFYWSGWAARVGLAVGALLLIVGFVVWLRGRRTSRT